MAVAIAQTADVLDLTDYKDGNNIVSCRVYQQAP